MFTNLFNQHAVVAYWSAIGTNYYSQWLTPGGYSIFDGPQFYKAAESPYNVASLINNALGSTLGGSGAMSINSLYGKPLYYQSSRSIFMSAKFTF